MKILIITGHYFPEIHPRAFRAKELAEYFSRNSYNVTVYTLRTIHDFDYNDYSEKHGLTVECIGLYNQVSTFRSLEKNRNLKFHRVMKLFHIAKDYLLAGNLLNYSFKIAKHLNHLEEYDCVISISTPFMTQLGTAFARFNNNHTKTIFIADSGDPFYRSQQTKRAPYFFLIEKFVYRRFNYLSIPNVAAVEAYSGLISKEKIRIIPQGFNFKNIATLHTTNEVPTFAYAGVFYEDIRNPIFLFDYLIKLDFEFKFLVFLRHEDYRITKMLTPYIEKLGRKVEIQYSLERNELLKYLAFSDFLINIENTTSTQIPSKLIDYAICKRPILSFNKENFNKDIFLSFCKKDYSKALVIDPEPYNIKNVANQFLDLILKNK